MTGAGAQGITLERPAAVLRQNSATFVLPSPAPAALVRHVFPIGPGEHSPAFAADTCLIGTGIRLVSPVHEEDRRMRIDVNPAPHWRPAPVSLRASAVVMYLLAGYLLAVGLVGSSLFPVPVLDQMDGAWWQRVVSVVAAYVLTDVSLLLLRGGKAGAIISTLIFSVFLVGFSFAAKSTPAAGLLAAVCLAGIVCLFVPSSNRYRATAGGSIYDRLRDARPVRAKKQVDNGQGGEDKPGEEGAVRSIGGFTPTNRRERRAKDRAEKQVTSRQRTGGQRQKARKPR